MLLVVISILGFDNKSLTISGFPLETAWIRAVLSKMEKKCH